MFEFSLLKEFVENKLDVEINQYSNFKLKRVEIVEEVGVDGDIFNNPKLRISENGIEYLKDGKYYKGFLYLGDGYRSPHHDKVTNKMTTVPRFHVYSCDTILKLKMHNQGYRYVFSNKPVKMTDRVDGKEKNLLICKLCRDLMPNEFREKINVFYTTTDFCRDFLDYTEDNEIQEIRHNIKSIYELLKKFRYDEELKIFTHKIDDIQKYIDIYKNKEKIENFLSDYYNRINEKSIRLLRNFLPIEENGRKTPIPPLWGEMEIHYTWNSEEVKNEIVRNNKNPWNLNIKGTLFKNEIDKFKHYIEFRNDNKGYTFNDIIQRLFYEGLGNNFEISFDLSKTSNLNTFIDVYNFKNGLEIIINWIKKFQHISNKVSVSTSIESFNRVRIFIEHLNSVWQKEIRKENIQGGDLESMRRYFFCIADVFIFAIDIRNKSYKISVMNEKTMLNLQSNQLTDITIEPCDPMNSVQYIIVFYTTS